MPYEADRLDHRLRQVDTDGDMDRSAQVSKTVTVERGADRLELLDTSPNPARSRATVRYALPKKQEVTLRPYNVLGRRVQTVTLDRREDRSETQIHLSDLSSDVYFLRLWADGTVQTQKLMVVR